MQRCCLVYSVAWLDLRQLQALLYYVMGRYDEQINQINNHLHATKDSIDKLKDTLSWKLNNAMDNVGNPYVTWSSANSMNTLESTKPLMDRVTSEHNNFMSLQMKLHYYESMND